MGLTQPHPGPSAAAVRRMNRILLCLLDHDDSLGTRAIIDRLSDHMTRDDADSAIRRLRGANQVEPVTGVSPAQWTLTPRGRDLAVRLVERGERY